MKNLIAILSAVFLLYGCAADKNKSGGAESGGDADYVSEGISEVVTNRDYHISIEVPGTGSPAVDKAAGLAIDSMRAEFIGMAAADTLSPFPYDLQITSKAFSHPPSMESYLLTIYMYSGGAHGNTFLKTYTIDKKTDELLTLKEALAPYFTATGKLYETVGGLVTEELIKRFGDNSWVVSGSGTAPENYSRFVLDGDTIRFYFPPYQVASYADGMQIVSLALDDLKH